MVHRLSGLCRHTRCMVSHDATEGPISATVKAWSDSIWPYSHILTATMSPFGCIAAFSRLERITPKPLFSKIVSTNATRPQHCCRFAIRLKGVLDRHCNDTGLHHVPRPTYRRKWIALCGIFG